MGQNFFLSFVPRGGLGEGLLLAVCTEPGHGDSPLTALGLIWGRVFEELLSAFDSSETWSALCTRVEKIFVDKAHLNAAADPETCC